MIFFGAVFVYRLRPSGGQKSDRFDTPSVRGHNGSMDRSTFTRLVREALGHLYDHAYLQCHPLAELLVPDSGQALGGETLHRVLLEGIEALRPSPRIPPTSPAWRPYLALYLRYVESMEASQVARELAISSRQLRREQVKGLEALTDLLWERHRRLRDRLERGEVGLPSSLLNEEVARLSAAHSDRFTPVEATVRGVLSTLAELATQRRVSLAVTLPPDLPPLSVDRVVLRQILFNVLTHLLDHGEGGSIEITGRVREPRLDLMIRYAGKGTFSTSPLEKGRLAVASCLVERQEGQMEVMGGDGLTVRLALPIRCPPTVLVIDDNPDVIQLFQRYLGGGAYRVVGAVTSQEALRLARDLRPYAITLDIMMPTQDGWEILQTLKNHPATRDIPVIVCSVLRERDLALSLGATDFLAKPVTQQALLTALARCGPASESVKRPDWTSGTA